MILNELQNLSHLSSMILCAHLDDYVSSLKSISFSQFKSFVVSLQKYQDDLQKLGLRIKQHEDIIKLLRTQKNSIDESILNLQGMRYWCQQSALSTIMYIFIYEITGKLHKLGIWFACSHCLYYKPKFHIHKPIAIF